MRLSNFQHFTITCIGILLTLAGILHLCFWGAIFRSLLSQLLILKPGSEMTKLWENPPLNLTLDVYMFNWTNPEQFRNSWIDPKFEEIGPYRYIEQPTRKVVQWHPENASLTYRKHSNFYFDAENSVGKESDQVTILNVLTVGTIYKSRFWNSIKRSVIGMALTAYGNDITFKSTIGRITFKGFDDNRMNLVNALPFEIPDLEIPYDKFGFTYPRNNSADYSGIYNIHTGANDINKMGKIHTWNYQDTNKGNPQCGKIGGSTGEFQVPGLKENDPLQFYITEFCHPYKVDYDKKVDVDGVEGYRYVGGLLSFDNGTYDKSNECFCKNANCLPAGVMNISSCWYNFPLFISYPHFYLADPMFSKDLEGIKPNQSRHELSAVLEPESGLLLELKVRFQLSMMVDPVDFSSVLRNAHRRFFPLIWVDYRMKVSPQDLDRFRMVLRVKRYGYYFGLTLLVIGLTLLLWHPMKRRYCTRFQHHLEIHNLNVGHMDGGKPLKSSAPERSPLLESLKRSHHALMRTLSRESANGRDAEASQEQIQTTDHESSIEAPS